MPTSTFPAGLDADLAKLWFGHAKNNGQEFRFDQNGPVSKLWLGLGRFPTLVWTDDFDTRTYFRFSDGTVIWRPDAQESYRVLQLPHRALGLNPTGNLSFPVGMDGDLAKLWFGQAENDGRTFGFNKDDEVSKRWLVSGRFPSLDWTDDFGIRTYFRFTDGTVIWRPDAQSGYRVLGVKSDGSTFPEGMDADLAKLWFGRAENNGQEFGFDQNDPLCQLWLKLRRYPSLVWTNDFDSRTYFRFADGTVIWRPDAESDFRVLGSVSVPTSFSAIWGGGERTINQEFRNLTGPDFYDYGRQYCLNGVEHTGIDVRLSIGDTLFAPVDGEIVCAGTGEGPGTDNQGCGFFADTGDCCPSPGHSCSSIGAGRIELKIDDNTVLILGHSRTCLKQPGDRVVAGEPIGTVGGMCGPHTHIEVRVRDEDCAIGWRIVDPRDVLGR